MAKKEQAIGVRLELSERAALVQAAAADHRPMSAMIRKIVAEWLRQHGWLAEELAR